jgi:hypothetical protein
MDTSHTQCEQREIAAGQAIARLEAQRAALKKEATAYAAQVAELTRQLGTRLDLSDPSVQEYAKQATATIRKLEMALAACRTPCYVPVLYVGESRSLRHAVTTLAADVGVQLCRECACGCPVALFVVRGQLNDDALQRLPPFALLHQEVVVLVLRPQGAESEQTDRARLPRNCRVVEVFESPNIMRLDPADERNAQAQSELMVYLKQGCC